MSGETAENCDVPHLLPQPEEPGDGYISADPPSTPGPPPYPGAPDDLTNSALDSSDPPPPYTAAVPLQPCPTSGLVTASQQNGLPFNVHIHQPRKHPSGPASCTPLLQGFVNGSALPTRYRPPDQAEIQAESETQERKPTHYMALALFTTLCICPVFGLLALMYSRKYSNVTS